MYSNLAWIKHRLTPKARAQIALLLTVPVCSIGVLLSTAIAPGPLGQGMFALLKLWLVVLPLVWATQIDGDRLRLPRFDRQRLLAGLLLGLLMFGLILAAYFGFGQQWIDLAEIRARATQVGIVSPVLFWVGSAYWTLINSFIEEAVWRNFIYHKCEVLLPRWGAVLLAALFFTAHHSIGLWFYTQDWRVVLLGSLGVFGAGVVWSACAGFYRSIGPGYISHILADGAIAIVGYHLLFS